MGKIRVYAVEGRSVPVRTAGRTHVGRFVARDLDGSPTPGGVEVDDNPAVWGSIDRGDLTVDPPAPAPETPKADKTHARAPKAATEDR